MTSGQKVAFSLLISVLAFCAFTVVAFSGLFDLLEVNFYQPIVQEIKQKKIDEITAAENEYFTTLIKRFNNFTLNPSVKTYVDLHPDDSDTQKREILRAQLLTSTAALKGIRIIDKNGRNLYFSTFADDVLAGKKGTTYKNYENTNDFDFNSIMANSSLNLADDAEKKAKIIKNGDDNQLIFSLPFYNTNDSFAGTILFYCDASNFSQFLFNRNLIDINGFAALITPKKTNQKITGVGGFVFGLPNYGRESIKNQILKKWEENPEEHLWKLVSEKLVPEKLVPEKQLTEDDSARENQFQVEVGQDENEQSVTPTLCAFSFKNERDDIGFITFLYDENELKFPNYMRILLLSTAFVTLYLAFFLILSFKHDDIVVIRDRIHRYESEFFIGCKKMGELGNPEYLSAQKDILEKRIFKSLGKKGRKHAAEFKSIFESTWQEMLFSFSGFHAPALMQGIASPINADELKQIVRSSLEDILGQGKLSIESVDARDIKEEIQVSESENEDTEDTGRTVEDFEEEINPEEKLAEYNNAALEEALLVEAAENESEADIPDFVEEAEAVEKLEEPVEEAEPLEEAEAVEELEAPAEEAEPLEEVEDAEELEEPAEEPEPLEEAETVEELEELAEEPEPLEEVEDAEELEEPAEDPEPLEEAEAVEELEEPVEEPEPLEEAEAVEELEEPGEEPEPLEEAEAVEELEAPAEEPEPPEEVEAVEELEEPIEEPEPLEEVETVEELEAPAEEPEPLEEAEAVEELEEPVEEIEPLEEAEAVEELEEPVEEPEPLEEAEDVEEAEAAEEIEPLEEAEAVEELEAPAEEPEPLEEAEAVEELEELAEEPEPLEEAEDVEELEELGGITTEADISEEIEPFTGPQQLKFETIAHGTSDNENDENHDDFVPASPRETFKELYEDLETLEEVSECEERAADLAKTLAALPEKPPIWTIEDNETLDSQGLSREFSSSELHDFQKLHDVAKTMDEIDTTLEELEPYDYQPPEESSDFDAAIKDVTKYPEDDFYKDEVLLEKIEFGVPTSELTQEATDDSVADNFIATAPDYTYLDEENLEEKALYQQEAVKNIEEDAHFYTNPNPLSDTEKNSEENEKNPKEFSYSAEDNRTTSTNEISMDSVPDISKSSEKLNEPVPEDEIEEIEELEVLDEVVEELSEENADIVSEQDDSDIEEVEALEGSEENMPFMFTKIGSVDSSVSELMPDTSDVIVQENDGTFRLTEMPQVNTKLSLNIEFKKLVDSVLR